MATMRQRSTAASTSDDDAPVRPSTAAQIIRRVRALDVVYPKAEEEALTHTSSGASLTLVTLVLSTLLFLSELYAYLAASYTHSIHVDTSLAHRIPISFNISFPHLQCSLTSIDVMDVSGEVQVDAHTDIYRTRLSASGVKIGAPFTDLHVEGGGGGVEHRVDRRGEGCLLSATLSVNKVAGNVHIALGASHAHDSAANAQAGGGKHMHMFQLPDVVHFDASHRITDFRFGPTIPTAIYPLDGAVNAIAPPYTSAHFQYFIKIVPTLYTSAANATTRTHQYSVTSQTHYIGGPLGLASGGQQRIPGVFFVYDLSPFMVHVREKRVGFGHFLVSVCAIVGGVVTVAGMISSCVFYGTKLAAAAH